MLFIKGGRKKAMAGTDIENGAVPIDDAGKEGDVVIWDSDPFTAVGAAALYTIIEGKIVYKAE